MGLLVERILDIVEDAAELKYPASRDGVLHSAVIAGKVTELIDIAAVIRSAGVKLGDLQTAAAAGGEVAH